MALSRDEVIHISKLVRIGMTEEEIERFGGQLSNILDQFEVLKQVDTEDVPPTAQSFDMHSVFRGDAAGEPLTQEEALINAPRREGAFFRVKAVLEE